LHDRCAQCCGLPAHTASQRGCFQSLLAPLPPPPPPQVLISLTQLGVPDALRSGPKSGAQLAAEVGAHLPYLLRVLRAAERMGLLAAAKAARTSADSSRGSAGAAAAKGGPDSGKGRVQLVLQDGSGSSAASSDSGGSADNQQAQAEVVAETEEEGADVLYELTQLSAVLCGDHPNSVRAMVLLFGDHYAPFGHLAEGVRGGRTAYELWSGGLGHWEHMAQQPALLERFNRCARARVLVRARVCLPGARGCRIGGSVRVRVRAPTAGVPRHTPRPPLRPPPRGELTRQGDGGFQQPVPGSRHLPRGGLFALQPARGCGRRPRRLHGRGARCGAAPAGARV
jgi:hypothetical protein